MTALHIPLASGAPLLEATFLHRFNQFTVDVQLRDGRRTRAHLADRGRLPELLNPGVRLVLAQYTDTDIGHKTSLHAVAIYARDELVSLDTHLAHRLVAAGLEARAFPQFAHYPDIQTDAKIGPHRFDFQLRDDLLSCILDVKSVNYVRDDIVLFPDVPGERERLHVEALTNIARNGRRAVVLFIVPRSTGRAVALHAEVDPAFTSALRHAMITGVEVYAYRCPVSLTGITLEQELPVYSSPKFVSAHV